MQLRVLRQKLATFQNERVSSERSCWTNPCSPSRQQFHCLLHHGHFLFVLFFFCLHLKRFDYFHSFFVSFCPLLITPVFNWRSSSLKFGMNRRHRRPCKKLRPNSRSSFSNHYFLIIHTSQRRGHRKKGEGSCSVGAQTFHTFFASLRNLLSKKSGIFSFAPFSLLSVSAYLHNRIFLNFSFLGESAILVSIV